MYQGLLMHGKPPTSLEGINTYVVLCSEKCNWVITLVVMAGESWVKGAYWWTEWSSSELTQRETFAWNLGCFSFMLSHEIVCLN